MENTIKNMELILTKMGIELGNNGVNQAKTLSNTYSSLLKQYMEGINYNSLLPLSHTESLNWQRAIVLQHFDKVNQMINNKLKEAEYVAANNLSVVSDKLTRSASDLKGLIGRDARIDNLPQNKVKESEKIKHVAIFGKDFNSSQVQFTKLRSQFLDEIKSELFNGKMSIFRVDGMEVRAVKYSDSFRGLRLDEIYIDVNLPISALNVVKSLKKDKNVSIHYF